MKYNKKILIFGGTGNISLYLTNNLKNIYDVTILNKSGALVDGVKTIKGDINDLNLLNSLADKYDIIFDFLLFNKIDAKNRIEIFKNVSQYFYISSVVVFDREKNIYITENSPKGNKYSNYAKGKLEAELEFLKSDINYTIIRPSQTYSDTRIPLSIKGKYCYPVIQRIIDNKNIIIHGDGTNLWSCMHSIDMVNILEKLILNPMAIRQDFNVCGTEKLNFNMIYEIIANQLNKKLNIIYDTSYNLSKVKEYDFKSTIYGDKRYSSIFDNSKLKSVISEYEIQISMKQGISRYLNTIENKKEIEPEFDIWCDNYISKIKDAEN